MGKIRVFRHKHSFDGAAGDRAALPRLIPIDPNEISEGLDGCELVIGRLASALRRERARAGHWTYDLDRHLGLRQALEAEQARRRAMTAPTKRAAPMGGPE
jgi:hypothetical protein